MYKYKVIDIKTWDRKSQYEWFSSFANPCYGIDSKIDVSKVVKYSKETKTSFFINFLFLVTLALNSVDELRMRIVKNEVRLYECINPTYTVMTNKGFFENGAHIMSNDYKTFYERCHNEIETLKVEDTKKDGYNDDSDYDDYYITCLPWLSYEGMTHPLPNNNPSSSSCPRVCWGKYYDENGKLVLSFNLTVSHALVDGYPTCKAINKLMELCDNCYNYFK